MKECLDGYLMETKTQHFVVSSEEVFHQDKTNMAEKENVVTTSQHQSVLEH